MTAPHEQQGEAGLHTLTMPDILWRIGQQIREVSDSPASHVYLSVAEAKMLAEELDRRSLQGGQPALPAEVEALRAALEGLKHGDGCYCEASMSGPGCHPKHAVECRAATEALDRAMPRSKGISEHLSEALVEFNSKLKNLLDIVRPTYGSPYWVANDEARKAAERLVRSLDAPRAEAARLPVAWEFAVVNSDEGGLTYHLEATRKRMEAQGLKFTIHPLVYAAPEAPKEEAP